MIHDIIEQVYITTSFINQSIGCHQKRKIQGNTTSDSHPCHCWRVSDTKEVPAVKVIRWMKTDSIYIRLEDR
jgi:hypothetical protein